jgi:hypothetical protein
MVNGRESMLKDEKKKARTVTGKEKITRQMNHETNKMPISLDQVIEIQDDHELSQDARTLKMKRKMIQYLTDTYHTD